MLQRNKLLKILQNHVYFNRLNLNVKMSSTESELLKQEERRDWRAAEADPAHNPKLSSTRHRWKNYCQSAVRLQLFRRG